MFFRLCPRTPVEVSLISNRKIQLQAGNQTGKDGGRIVQAGFGQDKGGFDALVRGVRQDKQLQNLKIKFDGNVHQ